ncbi:ferric-dicitrate binding protein FerR (iron transport regulator) [Chryseobacterium sediminis]|uniref:Ferric-dicitrate binding protein FerR (Iron transport regulator) n=1 Tax=Chryseobacterium sediminis TaxID=1679494 RepID=A0ABR6PVJ0_9FLAO|nr:FecR family protein [Chryseobacterium sediminis]MBB6329729.1 ferric-dicitrate binding protein FerR (iron transport regulator) [Chryseobacterium sediminis]
MKNRLTYKNIEAFVFRLWEREVSEDPISEKEKELLTKWRIRTEKDLDAVHKKESRERILSGLEHYFPQTDISMHSVKRFKTNLYKIAAVIILLLSLGGIFTYTMFIKPDVYLAKSENRIVHLEDGSVVTLLPGAELTVEKSFPASTRVVDLKGDAIFSVAKSKVHPFVVRADGFSTKVLGTVFKISQSGKKKAVDLYEGKVAVSSPGVPVSFLKPNQKWTNFGIAHTTAVISISPVKNSAKKVSAILSLSFNDVPLKQVITVLESSYSTKISYPKDAEDKKITADFTGGTVGENIESLAFILGLEVQKKENTYILKK